MRTVLIYMCVFATTRTAAETYEYSVTMSDDMSRLDIEARFAGGVSRVTTRSRSATDYLLNSTECETGEQLQPRGRSLAAALPLRCLSYSVDLQRAAQADAGAMVLPVAAWMWRPRLGGDDEVVVTFRLPEGTGVSVPWRPIESATPTYRLTSSPQSGTGLSVLGHFDEESVSLAAADLRIAVVPSDNDIDAEIVEWTRKTAEHVTLAYGRFPSPHARVLLFPAANRRGDAAVRFGRVVRDGGETVELFVDPSKPEDQFVGDWTATHEFAHLLLPYIRQSERWISEGFAQYYQNVLLSRAGRYSELDAWQKISDGLERGLVSAPELSPNEAAASGERNTRMKVYWSGAAVFLMADVELRRRSGGAVTLDTVLDRFQSCCLPSPRSWSGDELFSAFDSLIDEPLFAELHRRHADSAGFPPFRPLLEALGIVTRSGAVSLRDDAELADIRAAITARRYTGEPEN